MVLQRRRHDRRRELELLGQVPERVVGDRRLDRAAALQPVGHQLGDAARIHHRAGDAVRADLLPLLEDGDREPFELLLRRRFVVRLDQLGELVCGGETRGPRADDDDIDVESLALDAGKFGHACSLRCTKSRGHCTVDVERARLGRR